MKDKFSYAEFEIPMRLSSKKGHFWNSREILRYRNLTANDVEVKTAQWEWKYLEIGMSLRTELEWAFKEKHLEENEKETREENLGRELCMKAEKETKRF